VSADKCQVQTLQVLMEKMVSFSAVCSDDCIFSGGVLVLPWWMGGRLKPSEWKPLMASILDL